MNNSAAEVRGHGALKTFIWAAIVAGAIFIPLIVVNCIILARAESFASKNSVGKSALDGIGMGLGFTVALCIISAIREFLGAGSIWGVQLYGEVIKPASIITLAPGGFIVLGLIIGAINAIIGKVGGKND